MDSSESRDQHLRDLHNAPNGVWKVNWGIQWAGHADRLEERQSCGLEELHVK
jgi:hypothetical protein